VTRASRTGRAADHRTCVLGAHGGGRRTAAESVCVDPWTLPHRPAVLCEGSPASRGSLEQLGGIPGGKGLPAACSKERAETLQKSLSQLAEDTVARKFKGGHVPGEEEGGDHLQLRGEDFPAGRHRP